MKVLIPAVLLLWTSSFLPVNKADTSAGLKVTVNYFDEKLIPRDIAGDCSERYAFDTLRLRENKMVLFTDLCSMAMMKINSQLIRFKLDDAKANEDGKETTRTFSGRGYKLKFTSKEIKQIDDEYFIHSGIIEITKNGQKKTFYVTGKYGC